MGRGRSLGSVMPSVGSGRYSPGVGRDFAAVFFVAAFFVAVFFAAVFFAAVFFVAVFFAEPANAALGLGAAFFMSPFTKGPAHRSIPVVVRQCQFFRYLKPLPSDRRSAFGRTEGVWGWGKLGRALMRPFRFPATGY